MQRPGTRTLVATATAVALVAGGGAAIAATQFHSPQAESQAVIDDAAKQLGVDSGKLEDALRTALANRVDRAVAAGTITKEQGDALKARIQSPGTPLFGGAPLRGERHLHHFGPAGDLSVAADYLGVTKEQLLADLRSGKSLADVAKEKGKSVDGLVDALVADVNRKLDDAVKAGRLTEAQRKELGASIEERVTALVNGEFRRGFRPRFRPALRPPGAFGFRFRDGVRPERRDSGFRVFS
jgi:hypothetical protein